MRLRASLAATLRLALGLALALLAGAALAQSVALPGMLGNKALLMVDGARRTAWRRARRYQGVKVISTAGDQAVVEIDGKRHTLRVGDAPASVGGSGGSTARGSKIVLTAGSGGHFMTPGSINGRAVQFMVDTGATRDRHGRVRGRAHRPELQGRPAGAHEHRQRRHAGLARAARSVRVGDVEVYGVDAVVMPQPMPYVLLGNSFPDALPDAARQRPDGAGAPVLTGPHACRFAYCAAPRGG